MKDENRSKQQLVNELNKLRRRVLEHDSREAEYKRTLKELQKSNDRLEKKTAEQERELQGINERLKIIVESAQSMTVSSEIDNMGELLLKEFARTMAAEGGSIYRVEDDRLVLEHSLDPGHASEVIPLPLKKGAVLERALKIKKPVLIKDIEKEKDAQKSGWDGYRDGSLIVFPISNKKGEVAALIALHNKKSPPFVEQDRKIGLMLASYSFEALRAVESNRALRESEKLLKNILSASSVGIAYARERLIVWANEAMEKIFGFEDEEEYLGQTTSQLYASDKEYERVGEIVYEGIKAGQELMEMDVKLKRKDGTVFDGHARVSFIDPSNPIRGIIVSIIDITERKRAEELLRESEEKYRNLFENSIEAVFTVDLEGNLTSINKAIEKISDYSRDELIGSNAFDFMKPELREDVYEKYNRLFRTGEPIGDSTYVFLTKTGEERILEGYVNAIRQEDRVVGFQGTLRDITEKREAEEKLRISEERYRDLVENIEDIVYILDDKGDAVFFNKAAEKCLGYSRDELFKMNYKEFITPESNGYGTEVFRRRLSGEDVGVVEYQFYNKKGEIITVETHESFVFKEGRVVEVHGIGRDITERKKAEEELRESEERYRNLVDTSKDGIVVVQDEKIVFISKVFTELLGYSEEEILGESPDRFLCPEDINRLVDNYGRRLSGEEVDRTYEFGLIDKEGRLIPVETNTDLINWHGKPAILSILRDITERKRAEEALIASERNYREIFNATNEAIFVHDSKTGAILDVNKSMCDMFGYTYEEAIKLNDVGDISLGEAPYAIEDAIKWIAKARDEGPQLFEWRARKKNNELFWVEVNLKHSNIGDKDCIIAVVRDITERKRAEEALIASERNYREVFNATNEAIFVQDIETGKILDVNNTTCNMLGFTREEILKSDIVDLSSGKAPYSNEYVLEWVGKAREEGPQLFEWCAKRKNGELFWVETNLKRAIIGGKDRLIAVVRDITERKQTEEKIKEINERMEATLNALPDIFFEVDRHGRIYDYRTPHPELLYAKPEDFLGKKLDEFIPEEQSKIIMDAIGEAVETGRHIGAVYSLETPEGASIFELSIAVRGDTKTEDLRLICLVRDITKRKMAEKALKESEEKYRFLSENIPDIIYSMDNNFNLEYLNETGLKLGGYEPSDVIGKPFAQLIHPEDRELVFNQFIEAIQAKRERIMGLEFRVCGKDKSIYWVELNSNIQFDEDGNYLREEGVLRDISEKKETEEALIESERKFRNIFETSKDTVFISSSEGRFLDINQAGEELSGYTREELLELDLNDLYLNPEDRIDFQREIERNGYVKDYEVDFKRKDGTHICCLMTSTIRKDEQGNILGYQGVIDDITEKVKAEKALKYSEERFKNIAENAVEWIWEVDKEGKYVYSSPIVEKILGYRQEEVVGKYFYDYFNPEDREELKNSALDVFSQKLPFRGFINRCIHKNGNIVWILTSGVPIVDDRGELIGYRGADTDISESKRAEELLKESEKRYRELVENIEDIIYVLDGEGRFKFINRTLEKNLGYNIDDVLNRNFKDFLTPDSYEHSEKLFERMLEGEDIGAFEIKFYDKDGRIRIIETRMQPIWEGNRIVELSGIGRDITDRKRIEQQLILAQRMEAVGALAGGMAHNFNNILVGVMGYSEFLISKKDEADPDYKALKTIHEGTTRASLLTRELLNIARGGEYRATKVSMNSLIRKILPLIRGTFDRSIEIETHLAEDLMVIEGDGSQLEQSVLNICINARDAMPQGGSIIIETYNQQVDGDFIRTHMDAREGNYVVLSITDTGIGMSQDVKEHIFEPFFTTKEDKGGTGMGLSTVYGIVKSHGGLVTLYSEEGEGSTFRLYFPAIKGKFREKPVVEEDKNFTGSATILLVDDEQVVIDMWGDFLLEQGHRVITARDGEEALAVYKEEKDKIDLVILDYVMPKMGGKDVLMNLRKINPDVKVLVSSGYSENGQAGEIVKEGADGFIQKPAQLGTLRKKIMEVLQYKRRRR